MRNLLDQFRTLPDKSIDFDALHAALDRMGRTERHRTRRAIDDEIARLRQSAASKLRQAEKLHKKIEAHKAIAPKLQEWHERELVLEPPGGSALHQLRQSIVADAALFMGRDQDYPVSDFEAALSEAKIFVVEHNWAKAFEGAGDFAEGEIRLPYDACAFEFRASGARILALMTTVDDTVMMQLFVRLGDQWLIDDDIAQHVNGRWELYHAGRTPEHNYMQPAVEFVGAQVRAICVALDAEVAETEITRVDGKFARAREKAGKVPPKDYYIVSLARRSRPAPLERAGDGEHGKKRLHFRRGHWRHYETFKTWIRWTLVGNPDLGFVDKEYRL